MLPQKHCGYTRVRGFGRQTSTGLSQSGYEDFQPNCWMIKPENRVVYKRCFCIVFCWDSFPTSRSASFRASAPLHFALVWCCFPRSASKASRCFGVSVRFGVLSGSAGVSFSCGCTSPHRSQMPSGSLPSCYRVRCRRCPSAILRSRKIASCHRGLCSCAGVLLATGVLLTAGVLLAAGVSWSCAGVLLPQGYF